MLENDLVSRVDELTRRIAGRRSADLACKLGCTACCHVQLTLAPVEADRVRAALAGLDATERKHLRARASELVAEGPPADDAPCVMLRDDGACTVYAARPLVCRTQGHALRYPRDSLPPEMVFATVGDGDITWCPLNYVVAPPRSEDVLEAETIDRLAGQACLASGRDPLDRVSLVDLALE